MGHQQRPHLDLPRLRAGASDGVRGSGLRDRPWFERNRGRLSVQSAFPRWCVETITLYQRPANSNSLSS
jgi:hypothetical protein